MYDFIQIYLDVLCNRIAIVLLIYIMVAALTGDPENAGTNLLELNTFIYIGILGALSYSEDFKMMIQNGFTRKYIFVATLSMLAFIGGIMSLVDTVTGNLLHHFAPDYDSLFGVIYGYGDILPNWIWLFLLYMLIGSLFYLTALAVHKLEKTLSLCLVVALAGLVLLAVALFRYVLTENIVENIRELASRANGIYERRNNQLSVPPSDPVSTCSRLLSGILCHHSPDGGEIM